MNKFIRNNFLTFLSCFLVFPFQIFSIPTNSIKTELISCEYGLGTTRAAIGFWDPAGYQIGSQFFWTEEKGDYLFTLDDLEIPDGFELIENFEPFVIPDKDFRTIDYLVNSQNPTLATIYASQKADIPQALTINYWTKDWDLVDSETEPIDIAFGQGGYPTILLGTDFSVDVPEGYALITSVPEEIIFPNNMRTILDLQVAPITSGKADTLTQNLTSSKASNPPSTATQKNLSLWMSSMILCTVLFLFFYLKIKKNR